MTSRRPDPEVRVEVSRHCELVVRGGSECAVLDAVTRWVREHHRDILIVGMQWANEWVLDDDGVAEDAPPSHVVTMQFRTGAQLDVGWSTR